MMMTMIGSSAACLPRAWVERPGYSSNAIAYTVPQDQIQTASNRNTPLAASGQFGGSNLQNSVIFSFITSSTWEQYPAAAAWLLWGTFPADCSHSSPGTSRLAPCKRAAQLLVTSQLWDAAAGCQWERHIPKIH